MKKTLCMMYILVLSSLLLSNSAILPASSIRTSIVANLAHVSKKKVPSPSEDTFCVGACIAVAQEKLAVQVQRVQTYAYDLSMSQSFPHFVGGIAAGLMECLVGHPLDTIRVRIMTSGSMGPR